MAAAAALAGWLLLEAERSSGSAPGGAAALATALLAGSLLGRRPAGIPAALVILGGSYGVFLAVEDVPLDLRAAAVAGVLLVVAELGYWSLELRAEVADEPGSYARRLAVLALLGLGACGLSAGLLALVDAVGKGGLAVEIGGAGAALAALLLLLGLARRV